MFQIDLNSDLKEEPGLNLVYSICDSNTAILNLPESCEKIPECGQIFLDMCNSVNMLEYT